MKNIMTGMFSGIMYAFMINNNGRFYSSTTNIEIITVRDPLLAVRFTPKQVWLMEIGLN